MAATDDVTGLLADIATGLWRLRQRFVDPATGEPSEAGRKPFRDVQMLLDRLYEAQIEVQDHTGAAYDVSQSLRVAAFQPVAGLEGDRIVETLKPSVYQRQQRIQVGEVIVAIPERTVTGRPSP